MIYSTLNCITTLAKVYILNQLNALYYILVLLIAGIVRQYLDRISTWVPGLLIKVNFQSKHY